MHLAVYPISWNLVVLLAVYLLAGSHAVLKQWQTHFMVEMLYKVALALFSLDMDIGQGCCLPRLSWTCRHHFKDGPFISAKFVDGACSPSSWTLTDCLHNRVAGIACGRTCSFHD